MKCRCLSRGVARQVRSPENVFFHVCWPLGQEEESIRREREAILEKKTMGNNYDRISNGKLDRIRKWN